MISEPVGVCRVAAILVVMCGALGACRATHKPTAPVDHEPAHVHQVWNGHTEGLERLHVSGLLEARWVDDSGNHLEQGDMETWISGQDVSMRLTKFGDVVMWLGDTDASGWRFNMIEDPTQLELFSTPRAERRGGALGGRDLRLLLGLDRMPHDATISAEDGRLTARWAIGDTDIVMQLDHETLHPIQVHMQDSEGNTRTALHRWRLGATPVEGSPGGRRMAKIVDITSTQGAYEAMFKLRFSAAESLDTAAMEERAVVFDVERLQAHLRPEEVVRR